MPGVNPSHQVVLEQLKKKLPRNVEFVGESFYVRNQKVWMRSSGLRKRMEKTFFRIPSSKRVARIKRARAKSAKRIPMNDKEFNTFRSVKREKIGIERGRQVHEELELFCKNREAFRKAEQDTTNYIFQLELAKKARQHPHSRPRGKDVPAYRKGIDPPPPARIIHSSTRQVIAQLAKWKLTPIASEVGVYDPEAGYATAIDLLCLSDKGKIWAVELKTGYDHIFKTGTRKMNGFMGEYLNNSALGQAILQIFIPTCTLRYHYGIKARGCVVLVNKDGVKIQNVPEEMKINSEEIYKKITKAMKK